MAFRPWHLALAVAPLVLASSFLLLRRNAETAREFEAAVAAEGPATEVVSARAAPVFDREPPRAVALPDAVAAERTLTKAEIDSDVALDAVFGSVTDSFGAPLASARVSLRAWRGSLDAELGSALTDSDGRYRIDVAGWPSELAIRRALRRRLPEVTPASLSYLTLGPIRLRLSADLPGYATVLEERTIDEVLGRPMRVDFRLAAGRALSGRVERVSETRAFGVECADVVFLDERGQVAARAMTDAWGEYTAYLADGVYQVQARRPGVGTAHMPDAVVDRSSTFRLPKLRLTGTNEMRGRVTYPDGSPVWGLVLQAEHASIAPQSYDGLTMLERVELERSEGLAQSFARTDSNGEFIFRALRGGSFQLRVPLVDDTQVTGETLQDSSSLAANLVFHGRRLRVEVQHVSGKGVPEAQLDCWRVGDDLELARENELPVQAEWGGIFYVNVEAGERLFLRAYADGLPYAWRLLQVSSLEYEDTVRILLEEGPQPETGATVDLAKTLGFSLGIELVGDDGKSLDGWCATATSPHGDVPGGWRAAVPALGGMLPSLPPGQFKISFGALDRRSYHCFESVAATVATHLGGSQVLSLRVPVGGRLRFTIPSDSDEGGIEQFVDPEIDAAWRGWSATALALDARREAIHLHLRPDDRPDHSGPRALPGAHVEAFPTLLPGRYELRLSREGSDTLSYKVTVRAGEVTTVAQ